MGHKELKVIIIKTPNSDRYLPIVKVLANNEKFNVVILEATILNNYSELFTKEIEYDTEKFLFFEGRELLPREIGCAASHNDARKIISKEIAGGVILEDDARIVDSEIFYRISIDFLKTNIGKSTILNLTGFRHSSTLRKSTRKDQNLKVTRIFGEGDLAVAYAITPEAAYNLYKSNFPISWVADWPSSSTKFFVPLYPPVLHGDDLSGSIILDGKKEFRYGLTTFDKLRFLSFYIYFRGKSEKITLISYIKRVYIARLAWRLNSLIIRTQIFLQDLFL